MRRNRYIGGALLAAASVLVGPADARAQPANGTIPSTDGSGGGFQTPRQSAVPSYLPTGQPGDAGFYFGMEFVLLAQTRAIGHQSIAKYGFYDLTGEVNGTPGAIVGSGRDAINTNMFRNGPTFQPGFNVEVGYRFDDGTKIFANYMQLYDAHYSVGASLVPPGYAVPLQNGQITLADSFVSSPVYSFNSQFAGPTNKVAGVPDSAVYGIWNAATQMDIKFTQRFQQAQAGGRVPVLMTDYSRVYGTGGMQFSWFFERFYWRAVSADQNGNVNQTTAANYTNTLSQRMYGPFVGCGHEIFVANQFSLSCDLTGALLLNVDKQRAKYKLGDNTIQSKWGNEEFHITPNANIAVNAWWYPIEGVQMRVGYQAMSFYNTQYMITPVGFNYGNIAPQYEFKAFRLLHGFNVGVGFFF
ncbi:MAG: hypothetical protein C0467_15215 [Planctomycetaceae bacterium]|nr:hypothetical protein [Planctomycetaceae bacterium]